MFLTEKKKNIMPAWNICEIGKYFESYAFDELTSAGTVSCNMSIIIIIIIIIMMQFQPEFKHVDKF